MACEAGFQCDEGAPQDREVAVEVEVLGTSGVFLEQSVAHPVVADFSTTPVAAYELREAFGGLRDEAAEVMAEAQFGRFAAGPGRPAAFGDDHQAAHMRQTAGACGSSRSIRRGR